MLYGCRAMIFKKRECLNFFNCWLGFEITSQVQDEVVFCFNRALIKTFAIFQENRQFAIERSNANYMI